MPQLNTTTPTRPCPAPGRPKRSSTLLLAGLLTALVLGPFHNAALAQGNDMIWREVAADNLVFLQLQEGQVVIELNTRFAPKTVEQFRRLVQSRFYQGLSFYRVIDGFVAQGGDGSDLGELSEVPELDAEFELAWNPEWPFTEVQENDLFAPLTGFADGFPVGRADRSDGSSWLLHCPGVIAMARNEDADSSRTDFYIVIGQAPRYLDRNMNVFGRVIHGMDVVQRIQRGPTEQNGIIQSDTARSRIVSMRLGTEQAAEERLRAYVPDSNSKPFERMLDDRRERKQKFFVQRPPEVLDICQVPNAGRVTR